MDALVADVATGTDSVAGFFFLRHYFLFHLLSFFCFCCRIFCCFCCCYSFAIVFVVVTFDVVLWCVSSGNRMWSSSKFTREIMCQTSRVNFTCEHHMPWHHTWTQRVNIMHKNIMCEHRGEHQLSSHVKSCSLRTSHVDITWGGVSKKWRVPWQHTNHIITCGHHHTGVPTI